MSKFADYNSLCADYDKARSAVGSDLYLGALQSKLQLPLDSLHVLDAGSGTGNYAYALLNAGVGKLTLMDASEGMMSRAKDKLQQFEEKRKEWVQHQLPTLPFNDNTFDAVMFNNVIHHLPCDDDFRVVRESIQETFRVLKPGGIVILQSTLRHQLANCWYYHLSPVHLEKFKPLFPKCEDVTSNMRDTGFGNIEMLALLNTVFCDERVYFNGSFDEIMSLDSFWELFSPEEIKEAREKYEGMKSEGKLKEFIFEHDRRRSESGQVSLIFAKKVYSSIEQ